MTRRKPAAKAGGRTGARKIKPARDSAPGPAPIDPTAKRSITKTVKLTPGEHAAQAALAKRQGQKWSDLAREALDLAVARGSTR